MANWILGALRVTLGLDTAEFESGSADAVKQAKAMERQFQKFGANLMGLGAKLTVGITSPLVLLGKQAVAGFVEQEKAMADVNAALKSMGDASGKTSEELGKTADALEMRSLFDAEVILKQVTAQLLTFGNVAGKEFDRAQQAAVDMATRLGGEPQSAAIMLGKALNDPVKGITALTRVGVQFTEKQKDQIEAFVKTGKVARAQGIILEEVERQFKGAAAAAADADPWRKAQVAIGQAMDGIGKAILPIIKPVGEAIASMANAFATLSEPMQRMAVIGGVLAAALGPVLMAVGGMVSAIGSLLPLLAGAGAALGPIALIAAGVAAAGYLIWQNWDKIAPVLEGLWETFSTTLGPPLQELISTLSAAFTELWNGPIGDGIRLAAGYLAQFELAYGRVLGTGLLVTLRAVIAVFTELARAVGDAIHFVTSLLNGDWAGAITAAVALFNRSFGGLPAYAIDLMRRLVTGVQEWVSTKLNEVWQGVASKIEWVKGLFFGLYDAVVGHSYIPDMVDGIAREMARLDGVMVDPAKKATKDTGEAMRRLASDVQGLMERLFTTSAALKQFRDEMALIDKAEKAGTINGATANTMRDQLWRENKPRNDDAPEIISATIERGGSLEKLNDFLSNKMILTLDGLKTKTELTTVRVAESFKSMAEGVLQSLNGLVGSIKGGGFLDILTSVLDLILQLGSIGVFGDKLADRINKPKVPAYASGTSFHPGGLAMVGERGPEIVNLPRGSQVYPNGTGPGAGSVVQIVPSPYFNVVVDGRIQSAAGPIMVGGADLAHQRLQRSQSRRVA